LKTVKCLVYLDDIIVFGKSLEDHNNKIIDVFERLKINNLKIEPSKCNLLKKECLNLGHIITEHGIKPDKSKIKKILEYPVPKNVKNIELFLGLSGCYRRFIKNYSLIAKPLIKKCKVRMDGGVPKII